MAQVCGQLPGKISQIVTTNEYLFHQVEYFRGLLVGDSLGETSERAGADQTQRGGNILLGDLVFAECDHLIEGRLRVTQAARAGASYFAERGVAYFHTFAGG